ncbi:peptidase domain-containing ABC transporter [Pseudovibrio sp. SPO723]|uniref:peptidase domain-containing ABC transporter n=1 Tax=Nesiotobacter zosterae TaxID=392721 RepID=UPI0029C16F10|nr:ATP-binding cassette domain-containing protein [Pseudovibrio sp. SPO723]MDX5592757.1 ATP-binding cassette domain-containing protein [Pseudovibrio sp. SPO723]
MLGVQEQQTENEHKLLDECSAVRTTAPLRDALYQMLAHFDLSGEATELLQAFPAVGDDTPIQQVICAVLDLVEPLGLQATPIDGPLPDLAEEAFPLLVLLPEGRGLFLPLKWQSGLSTAGNAATDEPAMEKLAELKIIEAFQVKPKPVDQPSKTFSFPRPAATPSRPKINLVRPKAADAALVSGFTLAQACLSALFPLLCMLAVDRYLPASDPLSLQTLAIGGVVAALCLIGFKTLRATYVNWLGRRFESSLSDLLFERILTLPLSGRQPFVGPLPLPLSTIARIREASGASLMLPLADALSLPVFLVALALLHPTAALVMGAAALLSLLTFAVLAMPFGRSSKRYLQTSGTETSLFEETLYALETIKLNQSEGLLRELWKEAGAKSIRPRRTFTWLVLWNRGTIELITYSALALQLLWGASFIMAGTLSLGAYFATFMLSAFCALALQRMADAYPSLHLANAAYKTLSPLLDLEVSSNPTPAQGTDLTAPLDLKLEQITFSYSSETSPVFTNLDLEIKQGEKVAILGKIGSGKTSLGRLLGAVYQPQNGTYTISNQNARDLNGEAIRTAIRVIGQDACLLQGTIRSNVTLGRAGYSDEDVQKALQVTGALDIVQSSPLGLDMLIEDHGRNLSSGQRQSIVMARAFLAPPPVLFLDEPTGNMDSRSERAFVHNLRQALHPDQTLILTTHRTMPLALVDRLIILGDGKVVAEGPKDAVIDLITG